MRPRRRGPELLHPAPLGAALVLALNDHVLKASPVAGWWTGKLSDVAGLFVAPVVLAALARLALARRGEARPERDRWLAGLACAVVATGFVALKLVPAFNAWAAAWLGTNQLDPTDLVALPAVVAAHHHMCAAWRPADRPAGPAALRALALATTALACMATSAPPPRAPRPFPAWNVTGEPTSAAGCARARAWVGKSGKTGFGVVVELTSDRPCEVRVDGFGFAIAAAPALAPVAVVELPSEPRPAEPGPPSWVPPDQAPAGSPRALPVTLALDPTRASFLYASYAFDNQALWNQGLRTGALAIALTAGDATTAWRLALRHEYVQLPIGRGNR